MTRKLSFLAPALLALSVGAANADAHEDMEACNSMLATAVGMSLAEEGYDTSNACNLSVSQLAQIKAALEESGMGNNEQIEKILMEAGG